jgi:hypothetical protein
MVPFVVSGGNRERKERINSRWDPVEVFLAIRLKTNKAERLRIKRI